MDKRFALAAALTLAGSVLATTSSAYAGDPPLNVPPAPACSLAAYHIEHFTYWTSPSTPGDHRCNGSGTCVLTGWLVAPAATSTNHKAIVMAHGSQGLSDYDHQSLDGYCAITQRLVDNGYVVFWPLRRGVYDTTTPAVIGKTKANPGPGYVAGGRFGAGTSPGDPDYDRGGYFTNTGWAASQWSTLMAAFAGGSSTSWYISYLEEEAMDDLNAAINAFVARKNANGDAFVDPARIAVAGHSIGGAFVTIASSMTYHHMPVAYASLSGAAMSWNNEWEQEMVASASNHLRPIYFQRALLEDPGTPKNFDSSNVPAQAAAGFNGGSIVYNYPKPDVQQSLCTGALADPSLHYWCVHSQFVTNPYFIDGFWWGRFIDWLNDKT